jgi:dienelactone hydrolase
MISPMPAPRTCVVALIASLAASGVTAAPAATADGAPPDPAPGSPAWVAREAANFAASQQRVLDRSAQLALTPVDADPRRALSIWSPARGIALETTFENRYGATIAATLLRPRTAAARQLPGVIIVPGFTPAVRASYHYLAQDLAEHGYLVLVFDPQAQGASDATGRPETCEPGGAWQEPQEMGLREQGSCAGRPPPGAGSDPSGTATLATHTLLGIDADHSSTARSYRQLAPTFVLGALDAVAWLRSTRNPMRGWLDPARIAIAGHSAGAYGAAQAANGDPRRRFDAAVALDGYHPIDLGVEPRVPTLWIQSEQELAPRLAPPRNPRTLHPTWASFDAFREAGVPAGHMILRSSTHFDFTDAAGLASRYAPRWASYYTLAWFDSFLRGKPDGQARLFAERFDNSVDVSSIGTGGLNARGQNVPPVIAGTPTADSHSYYYPGALAAFGSDCTDLRVEPCRVPAPPPGAGSPGRREGSTSAIAG